jgi:hypothetical protein
MLYNSGSMWPSVVVHEHWPVSQRMIVEMGDYAWSEHIVTVFLACQITIKNVQVQLTVKGKTTPDSYTPPPKAVVPRMWLSWNEVFRFTQTLARPSVGRSRKRLSLLDGLSFIQETLIIFDKWATFPFIKETLSLLFN